MRSCWLKTKNILWTEALIGNFLNLLETLVKSVFFYKPNLTYLDPCKIAVPEQTSQVLQAIVAVSSSNTFQV
jgi:hypothetical protein